MRSTGQLLACVMVLATSNALAAADEMVLIKDGVSDYVIVRSKGASKSEAWAAEDLAAHLKQMTGAALRIEDEGDTVPERAILVGDGPAARSAGVTVDAARLGDDGYVMKTVDSKLIIAGGRKRGTMYGVYDLLADLGCRWWSATASTIPDLKTVAVRPMDRTRVPTMEYRAVLYGDSEEKGFHLWAARNHINGLWFSDPIPEKYGGSYCFDTLAHTFSALVPPAVHMKDHPDFYALRGEKRSPSQLCLSNDALVPVVAEALITIADQHPEYSHVTFGQDDNSNYCECDRCKALYEKYGAPSGAVLDFTNKVAAIVKKRHPKLWVNTMAYRWSRQVPKGIRPADNVMVTFCSIECDFGRPLAEPFGDVNPGFVEDAEGWAKITRRIFVWDYTTNFDAYLLPFPNYYSITPNVKFFVDHKVTGLFEQGSHTTNNAQFSKLCLWVESQSMWNPEADGRKLVEEFIGGYYGPQAGPLILEYANLLHDKVIKEQLPVYATHRTFYSAPHLSPEVIARGEALFRKAEALVANDAETLRRVQVAHLPIQIIILKRPMDMWEPVRGLCPDLTWPALCEQFSTVAMAARVTSLAEGGGAARPFFEWVRDHGTIMAGGDGSDRPQEVRGLAPGTYRFWHAAQLDKEPCFLKKVDGACQGWAANVTTHAWVISHELSDVWDYSPGKSYRFFARYRGKVKPEAREAKGAGLEVGVYVKDGRRVAARVPLEQLDGQWHVIELGRWTKAPPRDPGGRGGPSFYICLNRDNEKNVSDVYVDTLWMVEIPSDASTRSENPGPKE